MEQVAHVWKSVKSNKQQSAPRWCRRRRESPCACARHCQCPGPGRARALRAPAPSDTDACTWTPLPGTRKLCAETFAGSSRVRVFFRCSIFALGLFFYFIFVCWRFFGLKCCFLGLMGCLSEILFLEIYRWENLCTFLEIVDWWDFEVGLNFLQFDSVLSFFFKFNYWIILAFCFKNITIYFFFDSSEF